MPLILVIKKPHKNIFIICDITTQTPQIHILPSVETLYYIFPEVPRTSCSASWLQVRRNLLGVWRKEAFRWIPNHIPLSTSSHRIAHKSAEGKPAYLCDSTVLRIQEDICIFQGEDTPHHSYIWDNSWLHSQEGTHDL